MKIECILKRKGGTTIGIGDSIYTFAPEQADGPHVAEVANPEHAQRLLGIPEAYRIYGEAPLAAPAHAPAPAPVAAPEQPKPQPQPEPATAEAEQEDEGKYQDRDGDGDVDSDDMLMLTKGELAEMYEEKFGEKPNARMTKPELADALLKAKDAASQ